MTDSNTKPENSEEQQKLIQNNTTEEYKTSVFKLIGSKLKNSYNGLKTYIANNTKLSVEKGKIKIADKNEKASYKLQEIVVKANADSTKQNLESQKVRLEYLKTQSANEVDLKNLYNEISQVAGLIQDERNSSNISVENIKTKQASIKTTQDQIYAKQADINKTNLEEMVARENFHRQIRDQFKYN
ncbi:MAG: hypothetical protein KJ583_02880 [Nanoarchaeota archaeon]|nr:hypothetical protein [Nanoarchaeota archaeon]MBU1270039.1 hypothetical protein [Nanoarchaeota archaeon]MBU1604239.1 hypothetical protein [Nanoarchaeota archaeon]MBU2443775.1 hypothetical protein [Nanoarchaeota archaeon]